MEKWTKNQTNQFLLGPGSCIGSFDWLDSFLQKNPSYTELSDRAFADWATKSGLSSSKKPSNNDKPDYGFGQGMDDFSSGREGCLQQFLFVFCIQSITKKAVPWNSWTTGPEPSNQIWILQNEYLKPCPKHCKVQIPKFRIPKSKL